MGSEFFINSQELENKVRELLPSQGGAGAGFDLSASTQIIPIIDLTESAEGSNLRQDLQSSISHDTATVFSVINTSTTVLSNTGYWRFFGVAQVLQGNTTMTATIGVNDGATTKILFTLRGIGSSNAGVYSLPFDFLIKLDAGDSVIINSSNAFASIDGNYRQIASIDGTLTNP